MRQTEKTHEQGRIRRKHDDVRTPYQRVAACAAVPPEILERLQTRFQKANPFALRQDLDRALECMFRLPKATQGQTEDIFETLV